MRPPSSRLPQNPRTNVHFSLFLAKSCRLCVGFERGRGLGFMWRRLDACGLRVPRLARCAGKRLRVSPAPRPLGFESPALGPNQKNGPVAGTVSNSMVGDEGFRVRLCRPRPAAARPAPCALRRKRLRVSPAPRPFGFESPAPGPNQKRPRCRSRFRFNGGR